MLTEDSPKLATEKSIEAPFGKRLTDQAVLRKIKGVANLKFWGTALATVALAVLAEVITFDRSRRLMTKATAFEVPIDKIRVEGDKIIIPALVVEMQKHAEAPASTKAQIAPIQVINFVNAKEIPPGSEGRAELLTGATNGLIKARLTEPVKVDGVTYLDAGVLLLGQGHSTEERLFVDFKKAVARDGTAMKVSAQAYDISDTILGLKGSRVGDMTLKLAASSGLNFVSGMALGMQTPSYDEFGRPIKPGVGDAALAGVSKAAGDQAQTYMEQVKNRPPIIEVKSGTVFTVTFDGGEQ